MSAVLLITYVALIAVSNKGIFMVLEKRIFFNPVS